MFCFPRSTPFSQRNKTASYILQPMVLSILSHSITTVSVEGEDQNLEFHLRCCRTQQNWAELRSDIPVWVAKETQWNFLLWLYFLLCSRLYGQPQYIAIILSKDNQNNLAIVNQDFSLSQATGENRREHLSLMGRPGTLLKYQLQTCAVLKEATPMARLSLSAHQQCPY